MFNGIINSYFNLFFLKNLLNSNFLIIKVNKKLFFLNIGESISLNGICLTLIFKKFLFFEFEFSYETFLSIFNFNNVFCNYEKSFNFFNNFNGYFSYSHINNLFILKNKILFFKIIKIYFISLIFFKKFFLYKSSICINGVNLTLNELFFFKNFFIFSLNILNFSYFFTIFKFCKILDIFNIEFDNIILFLLKNIF